MRMLHVLMVEDHVHSAAAARPAFVELGCSVQTVQTGYEARMALWERHFDIVCLDPRDACAGEILAQLTPGQYAAAWTGEGIVPDARFNGVLGGPVTPLLAAVTVAMALIMAAGARSRRGPAGVSAAA